MTARRAGRGRADAVADAVGSPAPDDDPADVLAPAHPDWLCHYLTVTGDADLVTLFRPAGVLWLGPGHPEARRWLWANWGTTQPLRHVAELPVPKAGQQPSRAPERLRLGFWSADWTPWPATARLRRDWPALRFAVRPVYDAG